MTENSGTTRKLILEGFVIVISILAAFGLDTWWDTIQEREDEQRVLTALDGGVAELAARGIPYGGPE